MFADLIYPPRQPMPNLWEYPDYLLIPVFVASICFALFCLWLWWRNRSIKLTLDPDATLRKEAWMSFDKAVMEQSRERLKVVSDLAASLPMEAKTTVTTPNPVERMKPFKTPPPGSAALTIIVFPPPLAVLLEATGQASQSWHFYTYKHGAMGPVLAGVSLHDAVLTWIGVGTKANTLTVIVKMMSGKKFFSSWRASEGKWSQWLDIQGTEYGPRIKPRS